MVKYTNRKWNYGKPYIQKSKEIRKRIKNKKKFDSWVSGLGFWKYLFFILGILKPKKELLQWMIED